MYILDQPCFDEWFQVMEFILAVILIQFDKIQHFVSLWQPEKVKRWAPYLRPSPFYWMVVTFDKVHNDHHYIELWWNSMLHVYMKGCSVSSESLKAKSTIV